MGKASFCHLMSVDTDLDLNQTRSGREFSAFSSSAVLPPGVTIDVPLAATLRHEGERNDNGTIDCEDNDPLPLSSPKQPPIPETTPPLTATERRKLRQKASKKIRQKRKKQAQLPTDYKLRASWVKKHGPPDSIRTEVNAKDLSVASNAWIGLREPVEEFHPTLEELRAEGYRYVEWNGQYVLQYRLFCFF